MISSEDYVQCVHDLVNACETFVPKPISVLLCGSLATGSIRPGVSDVIDATIVFQHVLVADESLYKTLLTDMVAASEAIRNRGLPFHPFHYYSISEVSGRYWDLYRAAWRTNGDGILLAGQDVRDELGTQTQALIISRYALIGERRRLQQLEGWTETDLASEQAKVEVRSRVRWFLKNCPRLACTAAGFDYPLGLSIARLHEMIPELPVEDFAFLQAFIDSERQEASGADEYVYLRKLIRLAQDIVDGIVRYLQERGKWEAYLDQLEYPIATTP